MSRTLRPSYANLTATLALVVALGSGGAYAAGLAKNSVGSPQIKNGAVKAQDVKKESLTGGQVTNESLTGDDIANRSITGVDVGDNTLSGQDINESTLSLPSPPAVFAGALSGSATLTGAFTTYATLTYTAPANGYVRLHAEASFNAQGSSGNVSVSLIQDAGEVASVFWDAGDVDTPTPLTDQRQQVERVVPVSAGTHTVLLQLKEFQPAAPTYSTVDTAQVTAEFFPIGAVQP